MQPRIPKLPGWALAANKKRVSLLHRTATTPYPCFGQDLGEFGGSWSCRTYPTAKLRLFSESTKIFLTNIFM